MGASPRMRWVRLGEHALECSWEGADPLAVQRRIAALAARLRGNPKVADVVVSMQALAVFFQDAGDDALLARYADEVRRLWNDLPPKTEREVRVVEIPVRYGGVDGPDLAEVARLCEMTEAEVIRRHCGVEYTVFFLGFQPGFAYLGGMDARLAVPRLSEPQPSVAAGSVGIGGAMTGVYPRNGPGGWRIIGRTELTLFDVTHTPPALLQPGDRVRFIPVSQP